MYKYNVTLREAISNVKFIVSVEAPNWSIAKSVVLNQFPMHIFISIKANLKLVVNNKEKLRLLA